MGGSFSHEDKTGKMAKGARPARSDSDPQNPTLKKAKAYASKYELPPESIVNSELEDDSELFAFTQKHVSRQDLHGIVVASDQVRKKRVDPDEVSENGVRALCQLVRNNLALEVFHYNGERLDAWRAPALIEALMDHPSLKVINLYDNKIDNDGANFVVRNLVNNPSLASINLGGNDHITAEVRTELLDLVEKISEEKSKKIILAF